jgi:hypothetical protein
MVPPHWSKDINRRTAINILSDPLRVELWETSVLRMTALRFWKISLKIADDVNILVVDVLAAKGLYVASQFNTISWPVGVALLEDFGIPVVEFNSEILSVHARMTESISRSGQTSCHASLASAGSISFIMASLIHSGNCTISCSVRGEGHVGHVIPPWSCIANESEIETRK